MNLKMAQIFADGMSILSRGGYDPRGPYAQACAETGWFDHSYGYGFNFWGIKKFKGWRGATIAKLSDEEIKGVRVPKTSIFCNPKNLAEGMQMYSKFVSSRYKDAWMVRQDAKSYLSAIADGKWATDSAYKENLLKILDFVSVRGEHVELLNQRMVEYMEVVHGQTA